jgi:hypothetical protein
MHSRGKQRLVPYEPLCKYLCMLSTRAAERGVCDASHVEVFDAEDDDR